MNSTNIVLFSLGFKRKFRTHDGKELGTDLLTLSQKGRDTRDIRQISLLCMSEIAVIYHGSSLY